MNKLGLCARPRSKAKRDALRSLSPSGEVAIGGWGGLFGGPGGIDFSGALGDGRARPMGSSATRKSGGMRKDKRKRR